MGKTNIFAILGLVFAFIFPILGLVFSIIALVQIPKKQESGNGLAIAGLIISIIGMLIFIPMMIGMMAYFGGLDPDNFLQQRCVVNDFNCDNVTLSSDGEITIYLVPYSDTRIVEVEMATLQGSDATTYDCPRQVVSDFSGTVVAGEQIEISFNCPSDPLPNQYANGQFNITYVREDSDKGVISEGMFLLVKPS